MVETAVPETSDGEAPETSWGGNLLEFAQPYLNGNPQDVVAVLVENTFTLPVVQQPQGEAGFVSSEPGVLTEFQTPKQYGGVGLLAHNYLEGERFFSIQKGMFIRTVRGDGSSDLWRVAALESYQALSPNSVYSDFISLQADQNRYTAGELFNRIYAVQDRLVLQTCIEANGDPSWGRLFIIAEPYTEPVTFIGGGESLQEEVMAVAEPEPTVEPAPEGPQVAYTIQAKLSHYTPWTGGTNCFRFVYGQCVSPMASGKPWQDYVDKAVACPREFPFGTQFVIFDQTWICWDRGGKIVKNWDGTYWLDLLTAAPPVPFGTVVEVGVIPPQ